MLVRSLAAAVTAAAVLALAPAAHADIETVRDARGDVQRDGFSARSSSDVVKTVGRHARGRVTIRMTVADLTPGNNAGVARIVTNSSRYYAYVERGAGRLLTGVFDTRDEEIRCPGMSGSIGNPAETLTMSIPRSCLANPRWVRFGAGVATFVRRAVFYDDARRRGGSADEDVRIGRKRLFLN